MNKLDFDITIIDSLKKQVISIIENTLEIIWVNDNSTDSRNLLKGHKHTGCYILFQKSGNSTLPVYIGESKNNVEIRLYNHFIKQGKGVGSVYKKISDGRENGYLYGFTFLLLNEPSLSRFAEHTLIEYYKAKGIVLWNKSSKLKK